jgi:hypothetical protein
MSTAPSRKTKPAIPYTPATYAVGYGKPPAHMRFRKGQSGNPGGRPRRSAQERAKAMILKEAYRKVSITVGDHSVKLPAVRAIVRCQLALAAKGNGPAQRAFLAAVQAIEQENAATAQAAAAAAAPTDRPDIKAMNYNEAARRICFLLNLAHDETEFENLKAEAAGTAPSPNAVAPADAARAAPHSGSGAW